MRKSQGLDVCNQWKVSWVARIVEAEISLIAMGAIMPSKGKMFPTTVCAFVEGLFGVGESLDLVVSLLPRM
eukprot:5723664-Lingulodinium_polyedra.AAC.1